MNQNHITIEEATSEASHSTSTANELDIVVSKIREINNKRSRVIKQIEEMLDDIEDQIIN